MLQLRSLLSEVLPGLARPFADRFANKTLQTLLTIKLGGVMIELQRKLGMEMQV